MSARPHRFLVWGTFDTGKPRVRVLIEALRLDDPAVPICHRNPWQGIEDKTQISGLGAKLAVLARWLLAYPALIWAYLRAPAHDVVVVPYPGNLDVLVLWPFARLRGARICWDMFLSLYDTAVIDRALLREGGLPARILRWFERLSTRAADLVLLDTQAHAAHVAGLYDLPRERIGAFWVGAEPDTFRRAAAPPQVDPLRVLFYGQFIPLHGLDTIVAAIARIEADPAAPPMNFTIVGTGQERPRIDQLIEERGLRRIERIEWVDYAALPALIEQSAICLGVFAPGGKAARVIPNKVFQILAVGRPLVTMDSPAIREIAAPGPAVRLVPPGDAESLAQALMALGRDLRQPGGAAAIHQAALATMPVVDSQTVREQFRQVTEQL